MSKGTVKGFFSDVLTGAKKHGPAILTTMGVLGFTGAVVTAVLVTPKATKKLEEKKQKIAEEIMKEEEIEQDELPEINLSAKEVVTTVWKYYLPVVLEMGTASACVIGAQCLNSKKQAALEAACAFTTAAFSDYKAKVIETIGEKRDEEIEKEIAKEKVENTPVEDKFNGISPNGDIILPNNILCMDVYFGKYFRSDKASIEAAVKQVTKKLAYEVVSVNEFYDLLDTDHIPAGDEMGWDTRGMDVKYGSCIAPSGEPCLTIIYTKKPSYDFGLLR